ncbi:MAG TPA: hypothetical protein VFO36_05740, partial [Nitrospiraceae bacterium]|nr:hypothetical protein [Nitrospiraceae bacterium]
MNRDLFLSILALDSYNRDYNAGLVLTGQTLGTATILRDSDDLGMEDGVSRDEAAEFYAIAYNWNGETVISYRGTDAFLPDAFYGYGIGAGFASVPQGNLALEFYTLATQGAKAFDLTVPQNVVLTGHSLGGGLAGFVSTLTGVEAIGFDYMPFASAALKFAITDLLGPDTTEYLRFRDEMEKTLPVNEFLELMGAIDNLRDMAEATPEAF